MDLKRMPRQQLLVVFKTTVLIDSYLKDINMFFYSIFFLFKSFLCLQYIAVVHLFQCSREGQLGYTRGLGLIAILIGLFIWELLQVYIRGLYMGTSLIFLDLGLIYFFFLQFQYFPNIYFPFTCQALIEGARLDYPTYTITLLAQLLYSHNRLACIITQFAQLPSLYNYLVHTIAQLV